jgi:DNA repair exonuclease SbcCD ATPase subunit
LSKKEVKTNDEAVSKLNDAKKKLQNAKDKLQEDIDIKRKQLSELSSRAHVIATMKNAKESLVSKHKDLLDKLCNDCKQVFSKYYSIDEALKAMQKLDAESIVVASSSKKLQESCNSAQSKITEYNGKMQLADSRIAKLQAEYNKVSNAKTLLSEKLSNAKKSAEDLKKQSNPYTELIAENSKSISEETKSLDDIERKYRYLKFAENIVSQDTLRKLIVKDLITLLNNKIKTYLTKLGAKYYVKFDENMDYEFVTTNGTCEFGNFSAGEKMRTMIATSFAFRDFMGIRNGLNANILVLDEYFDSAISSMCIENMLEILKEYCKTYG